MSTGMRKWMEKDYPEIEYPPAQVLIDREELKQLLDRLEATEEDRARFLVEVGRLCAQCDALHAKIEATERQEPLDAGSDVFRSAFEAALKAGNWPATRQGDGYRSPSTQIAWRIAFSTVNRLKLYLAPGAQPAPSVLGEEAPYNDWFRMQQGVAYGGVWAFARAAWMARAKLAAVAAPEAKP